MASALTLLAESLLHQVRHVNNQRAESVSSRQRNSSFNEFFLQLQYDLFDLSQALILP